MYGYVMTIACNVLNKPAIHSVDITLQVKFV